MAPAVDVSRCLHVDSCQPALVFIDAFRAQTTAFQVQQTGEAGTVGIDRAMGGNLYFRPSLDMGLAQVQGGIIPGIQDAIDMQQLRETSVFKRD